MEVSEVWGCPKWNMPLNEIPAQTWTLNGCLGCPFNLAGAHLRRKVMRLWLSIRTEPSSVKMTSPNCSPSIMHFWQNSSLFAWFCSRISWQYHVPLCSQPSFFRSRFVFCSENKNPNCSRFSCPKWETSFRRFFPSLRQWSSLLQL